MMIWNYKFMALNHQIHDSKPIKPKNSVNRKSLWETTFAAP